MTRQTVGADRSGLSRQEKSLHTCPIATAYRLPSAFLTSCKALVHTGEGCGLGCRVPNVMDLSIHGQDYRHGGAHFVVERITTRGSRTEGKSTVMADITLFLNFISGGQLPLCARARPDRPPRL